MVSLSCSSSVQNPRFDRHRDGDYNQSMDLKPIFNTTDAKPFQPFIIEIMGGTRVVVSHPENIHFLPSRQKVVHIIVYHADGQDWTLIYPKGITALHSDGKNGN